MRTRVPGWLGGAAAALALLLTLLTWAFASPVGSSPDDDSHLSNIYCLHDSSTCRSQYWTSNWTAPYWPPIPADRKWGRDWVGLKRVYQDLWQYQQARKLPCYVLNGSTWYAPDVSVPATCLNDEDPADNFAASVDRLEYYPNLYYRFLSLFTGDTIRDSVATWRILNVLTATLMMSGAVLLSARRYRRAVAVGSLIASMPMGLFLVSSINPSSWLLIGSAAFLGPAVTVLRDRGSPRLLAARIGFLVFCLLMIVAGRTEGVAIAGLLVLVVLLIGLKAPKAVYAGLSAAVALIALIGVLILTRNDSVKIGLNLDWLRNGLTAPGQWDALMTVPDFFFGSAAHRLGWLEIVPPPAAVIATNAAFWGTVILGLAVMFWRKAIALVVVVGVLLMVPATLLAGGNPAQPTRYFLPLVFALAFIALVPDWGRVLPHWSTAQWLALGGALAVANSLSLLYLTVRYVSGINPGTTNPRGLSATPTPDWWWGAWLGPFANWLLGSLAFALTVGLLFSLRTIRDGSEDRAGPDRAVEPPPSGPPVPLPKPG